MEQTESEPEPGEPENDIYAQIEVQQHRLPEGYFPTKIQLLAQVLGQVSTERAQPNVWDQ